MIGPIPHEDQRQGQVGGLCWGGVEWIGRAGNEMGGKWYDIERDGMVWHDMGQRLRC